MNDKPSKLTTVIKRVIIICVLVVFMTGFYLHFRDSKYVVAGGIVLIIFHVLMAGGIIYKSRGILRNFFNKIHGNQSDPSGSKHNPETTGITISWAFMYDMLVTLVLLGREKKLRNSIVKLASIQPGEKVLDVGCGTGSLVIAAGEYTNSSAELFGIDAAPEMISRARKKANKAGVKIDFQTGLVEKTEFPDNTFDAVMNSFMVHHLPGDLKSKAFTEIYRILKSGGRLLIVDFEPPKNRLLIWILTVLLNRDMMKIKNRPVAELLKEAGFTSLQTGNAGHRLASFISCVK